MSGEFWYIFYLFVVLKIPVFGAMALIWWAMKEEPAVDEAPPSEERNFRRWHPTEPTRPRGPRRDPHGGAAVPPRLDRRRGVERTSVGATDGGAGPKT